MLTYAGSAGVRVSAYLRAYETHALKEAVGDLRSVYIYIC
jgi:hypothetical protein